MLVSLGSLKLSPSAVQTVWLKRYRLRLLDSGFAICAPIVGCVSAKVSRLKEWVVFVLRLRRLRTKDLTSNPFGQFCVSIARIAMVHVFMDC